MKHVISRAVAVSVAIVLYQFSHAAEFNEEDELLAAALENHEDPSIPGVKSEMERRALTAAGNAARRDGGQLILKTSKTTDTFIDGPDCKDIQKERDCGIVKLVAYAKSRNLFVLQHSWYGGMHYIVLDRTYAREAYFPDFKALSPTGDFVAGAGEGRIMTSSDRIYQPSHDHLEIWTRIPSGMYFWAWDDDPHYPKNPLEALKARYVVDGWENDDPRKEPEDRVVELQAHLEVGGKTVARFKVRQVPGRTGAPGFDVIDIPQ